MLYGKEMVQPYVVFEGKKGLKLINQILNTKPSDPVYKEKVRQGIRDQEARILKARAEKEKRK